MAFETGLRSLLEQHLRLLEINLLPRDGSQRPADKPDSATAPVPPRSAGAPVDQAEAPPAAVAQPELQMSLVEAERPDGEP